MSAGRVRKAAAKIQTKLDYIISKNGEDEATEAVESSLELARRLLPIGEDDEAIYALNVADYILENKLNELEPDANDSVHVILDVNLGKVEHGLMDIQYMAMALEKIKNTTSKSKSSCRLEQIRYE